MIEPPRKDEEKKVAVRTAYNQSVEVRLADTIDVKIRGKVDGNDFPTTWFWGVALVMVVMAFALYNSYEHRESKRDCIRTCVALFSERVEESRYGCICEERETLTDEEGERAARRFRVTSQISD